MKPYIILHMLISIDGKITGRFLETERTSVICEEYYRINREYEADAYACGRVTMETSFTGGAKPDLTPFQGQTVEKGDFVAKKSDFYAVSIDPHGRLGWYGDEIKDYDEGYDKAHIVEVLTEEVGDEYLAFLREKGISYIICGENKINVKEMNKKLVESFGINKLLLEGGGLTDSLFLSDDCIDELSIVVSPFIDCETETKELFSQKVGILAEYDLVKTEVLPEGGLWLNYKKRV